MPQRRVRGRAARRSWVGSRPPLRPSATSPPGEAFHGVINHTAYALKMLHHIQIGKPQHSDSEAFQIFRALCIVQLSRRFIMLATVQLYRQTCRIAIKIQNITSYNLLPYKARRISAQKIISQMAFLPRHAFSQRSGIFKDILVSRQSHGLTPAAVSAGRSPARRPAARRLPRASA